MKEFAATIISAIIAAIVALITSHLTRYTNVTTQSRIDWIQRVRNITIDFICSVQQAQNGVNTQVAKQHKLYNKLRMYLNPCEEIDKEIIETAKRSITNPNNIDEFSTQMQAYLKAEWERVKYESKGKKFNGYMFAKSYYKSMQKITNSSNQKEAKNMKKYRFDKVMYGISKILNAGIKLAIVIVMLIIAISLLCFIIKNFPYLKIREYLGI